MRVEMRGARAKIMGDIEFLQCNTYRITTFPVALILAAIEIVDLTDRARRLIVVEGPRPTWASESELQTGSCSARAPVTCLPVSLLQ